jgi:hypothetical protein
MHTLLTRLIGRRNEKRTMIDELQNARDRLAELEGQWNTLTERIRDGEATPQDYEGRPALLSRLQGAREGLAAAETRVQRNAQQQREAELMERVERTRREVGRLVPEMLMALAGMRITVEEIYRVGTPDGGLVDDLLGLPASFADDVSRAIHMAAPNTEWDYGATGPFAAAQADPPKLRRDNRVFHLGRQEPPPGSTSITNLVTGEVEVSGSPPVTDIYVG